jgi:hypothetical protein
MKKFIALMFVILALFSCRNDDELDVDPLVGDWEWITSTGGIDGRTETPTSTGKNIILSMKNDKTYTITTNGSVTQEGTYSLYKNVSNLDHYERTYIDFSNQIDQMIISNEDGKLVLNDDLNDGFISTYKKK